MKEGAEGHNLVAFLGCLGSESNVIIKVNFTHCVSYQARRKNGCRVDVPE